MANGMGSLYIASSGIRNSQNALNTTANNLANVDTKGYVRQQVYFSDKEYNYFGSASVSKQQAGLGLNIGDVIHARDMFLDKSYRAESGRQAFYETSYNAVDEVWTFFQEMEGAAFQNSLADLRTAFEEFSKDPSDEVNQNLVIQKASLFVTRTQGVYSGLKSYQNTINKSISDDIDKINTLGNKIKQLNLEISKIEAAGAETAMSLRDERDLALDELGALARISYEEDYNGVITVQLEGEEFVTETQVYEIGKKIDDITGFLDPYWPQLSNTDRGVYDFVFDFSIDISSSLNTDIGKLKASVLSRGDHWGDYRDIEGMDEQTYRDTTDMSVMLQTQAQLDQLFHAIVTSINDIYCPNVEGPAGVTYTDAKGNTIDLSTVKVLDAENCAVGVDGKIPPGELFVRRGTERYTEITGSDGKIYYLYNEEDLTDTSKMYTINSCSVNEEFRKQETLLPHLRQNGEVAQPLGEELAALWSKEIVGLSPIDPEAVTIDAYYQKMVGGLATLGSVYEKTSTSLSGTVATVDNQRQQVIGVSSDEELTNMIKYQNAYNASSRFMTVISDMLEHIITQLGSR